MLAADELVHQLRLRDIGGIIIVDFIDMDTKEHQQQLYDYVKQLMNRDRAKHNVLPLSKFGLMQITRQRVRPAVEVEVMETCPVCHGKGKIQPSILFTDQLEEACRDMLAQYGKGAILHLHPYIYAYVSKGWFWSLKSQWKRKYGVKVLENQSLGMLECRFVDAKGNALSLQEKEPTKPAEQPKKVEQPKTAEQPKKVEQPKPAEQPQKVEQPKKADQPKKVVKTKKAAQPKKEEQVVEEKPKAKRTKKAAKPKEAPVAPAEKSPAETKAPAAVKRKARAKKKSETQTSNNEENK
jgi:DNA segregation ATPase FtsK/SpoIIIE-like protein